MIARKRPNLAYLKSVATKPMSLLGAFVSGVLILSDASSFITTYILNRESTIRSAQLHLVEEIYPYTETSTVAAYLNFEFLLSRWPRDGVRISASSRVLSKDFALLRPRQHSTMLEISGIAGVKNFSIPVPPASTQDLLSTEFNSVVCIAEVASEFANLWNGTIYSVVRDDNKWEVVRQSEINEFSLTSRGAAIIQASELGSSIISAQFQDVILVTLDHFISFDSDPCSTSRMQDLGVFGF